MCGFRSVSKPFPTSSPLSIRPWPRSRSTVTREIRTSRVDFDPARFVWIYDGVCELARALQKVPHDLDELVLFFDKRHVPALFEHCQLGVRNELDDVFTLDHGSYPVVPARADQGRSRNRWQAGRDIIGGDDA